MRSVCLVLAVTAGAAHAETSWSEYGAITKMRPASQLVETACDVEVTLRGAIVEVELRQRLKNTGLEPLAASSELEIPVDAQLVALEVQHGSRKAEPALAVSRGFTSDRVNDPSVLGADPAQLVALGNATGRPRFRVVVQPIDTEREAVITTRWTRVADIHSGALHVTLPGHEGKTCRGVLHATTGPGTSIARVRIAGQETVTRTFALEARDLGIAVELAFKRAQPVIWTQSESLGEGRTAQAITVVAPTAKAPVARRVLFVIDSSRSMELVGRHRVKQLVNAIGGSLAPGTGIEAILYDRTPQRVFGAWHPVDAQQIGALETAIVNRTPGNGSDAAAALALARQAIGDADGDSLIVLVTDGVFGDIADHALAKPLESATRIQLHAVTLTRGRMASPDSEPVYVAINRVGGSHTEVDVEALDSALASLDRWLRPSYLNFALIHADIGPPKELHAGSGFVLMKVTKRPKRPSLLVAHVKQGETKAVAAPTAPIAELALARAKPEDIGDPTALARMRSRHPAANDTHAFVVLASEGKVAKSRREVAASGGPFTRMIALADPAFPAVSVPQVKTGGSSIDRTALELLFRTQLQPAAFACYQRAIARVPALAGTAQFRLEIGRGEMARATVTSLGDSALDACLLDAAYRVTPSLPNPDYNVDDRSIANYPLTFSVREDKPFVLPGDADSQSPLDIEAIKGGLPVTIKAGDTSTPLGDLKVPRNP
jgi:hypothetical protein